MRSFLQTATIYNVDIDTASVYGEIKSDLKLKGKPIPENDIWIAALAIQHKLELLSNDKHFIHVEGIKVIHL